MICEEYEKKLNKIKKKLQDEDSINKGFNYEYGNEEIANIKSKVKFLKENIDYYRREVNNAISLAYSARNLFASVEKSFNFFNQNKDLYDGEREKAFNLLTLYKDQFKKYGDWLELQLEEIERCNNDKLMIDYYIGLDKISLIDNLEIISKNLSEFYKFRKELPLSLGRCKI